MRKEIIFAIIAGIIFGLVVAFGVWRANSVIKQNTPDNTSVTLASPTPSTTVSETDLPIRLNSPQEKDVITASPASFSGNTKPLVWVVASTADEDFLVKSDKDGNFNIEVELSPGLNEVSLTAIDSSGEKSEQRLQLVYSTEFN